MSEKKKGYYRFQILYPGTKEYEDYKRKLDGVPAKKEEKIKEVVYGKHRVKEWTLLKPLTMSDLKVTRLSDIQATKYEYVYVGLPICAYSFPKFSKETNTLIYNVIVEVNGERATTFTCSMDKENSMICKELTQRMRKLMNDLYCEWYGSEERKWELLVEEGREMIREHDKKLEGITKLIANRKRRK